MIARKRRLNAWLNQRVAVHDAAVASAELRAVEGMRHGSDQTGGGVTRQTSIRVQGDDIPDIRDCFRGLSARMYECGFRRTSQEQVQLMQLPALALPPHPFSLGFIPYAPAIEQEK